MTAEAVDYTKLASLFALEGRICLFATPEVVAAYEAQVAANQNLIAA